MQKNFSQPSFRALVQNNSNSAEILDAFERSNSNSDPLDFSGGLNLTQEEIE
jgi:hypothetical protein